MVYNSLKFWSIFNRVKYLALIVLLYVIGEYQMVRLNGGKGKWWVFALFYLIDVFFFFFNCFLLYPRAYELRKSLLKPIFLILIGLLIYYCCALSGYLIANNALKDYFSRLTQPVLVNFAWRVVLISALSALPFGFFTYIKMLKRERVLENNLLYARISPHLIFNCLNFIHSGIRGISEKADNMITCMSEYCRYAMAELAEDGKTNLEAELAMVKILKQMSEIRQGQFYLDISVNMRLPTFNYRIPPHLILTLAENSIKYGVTADPDKRMAITLTESDKLLKVTVHNWKDTLQNLEPVPSHKLGLDNLRKRLENMYGGLFVMKIEDDLEIFSVTIVIPI